MENISNLLAIILPAFAAGVAVSLSHAPLGREVLKRGIIFIDLAIAQIAALGVIIAKLYFDEFGFIEQILAFIFAISAAYFFMYIEKKAKQVQEAIIGCSFIIAISIAMLLVANDPHGGGKIEEVLTGQILWASWADVAMMMTASAITAIVWFRSSEEKRRKIFYPLFAICVTFSVQIVGVYLVFASLIFPALAIFKLQRRNMIFAYLISIFSYLIGIITSYLLDLPTSPVIVITLLIVTCLSAIFLRKIEA